MIISKETTQIISEKNTVKFKRNNGNLQKKKMLKFKKQKLMTAIDNNGVKNKTKNDKVLPS